MLSPREFRNLTLQEQKEISTIDYSKWDLYEDLSNKQIKNKLRELEKKLKNYDYTYVWSDDRNSRKRGEKQRDEILKLKDEIGDEGQKMWMDFLKAKGMVSESNLSPSDKASIKKYMKELEKLCKKHNWHWMYEKDDSKFKHGQFAEQKIRELVIEIKELGSIEGFNLYQKYAAKNGIKINYFKEVNEKDIYDYERYFHSKLKKWGIKSVEELTPENRKKFDAELDSDWDGGEEIKVNMPEDKCALTIPEMNSVVRNGTLGYGDDRRVGEKSLTAGTFGDYGNLYPEHITPKFIPPSEQRKRRMQ